MTVFVALFYMYGTKVAAMKHRTGMEQVHRHRRLERLS